MIRFFFSIYFFSVSAAYASDRLLVFAAASQHDVMLQAGELYEQSCGCEVKFSFAATSTLARQIAAGADAAAIVH